MSLCMMSYLVHRLDSVTRRSVDPCPHLHMSTSIQHSILRNLCDFACHLHSPYALNTVPCQRRNGKALFRLSSAVPTPSLALSRWTSVSASLHLRRVLLTSCSLIRAQLPARKLQLVCKDVVNSVTRTIRMVYNNVVNSVAGTCYSMVTEFQEDESLIRNRH